jgi:hypothetical protein
VAFSVFDEFPFRPLKQENPFNVLKRKIGLVGFLLISLFSYGFEF